MNEKELDIWRSAVDEYKHNRTVVENEKKEIINKMYEHLSQFFNFDDIEFDENFEKITLYWKPNIDPVIRIDFAQNLGFDFIISCGFYKKLGYGIQIEIYPFKLP